MAEITRLRLARAEIAEDETSGAEITKIEAED